MWKLQDYRAGAGRSGPSKWGEVSAVLLFPLLVWKLNSLWLPEKGARISFYLCLAPETHISATIKVITFIPRWRLPSPPHNRGSLLGGFKGLLNTGMDTQRDAIIPGGPSKQLINTDRQSFTHAKRQGAEDSAKHCGGREERRRSPCASRHWRLAWTTAVKCLCMHGEPLVCAVMAQAVCGGDFEGLLLRTRSGSQVSFRWSSVLTGC